MLNIKVKTKDFLKAIRIVENAIDDDKLDTKNSGVYIETKDNKLEFKGLGFNLFIKCECDAQIIEEGKIIIKHKLVEEFLRKVTEEFIELKEEKNSIKILSKGSIANYSLIEYEKAVDLSIVSGVEYIFDKNVLSENIENSQFAVSTDISKTIINCIKFDIEEKVLKLVSTDSYRLMYREVEVLENTTNENISVSISLKIIQALLKVFKESTSDKLIFRSEGTRVLFKLDDIEIITKVVEMQFPDYENILQNVKITKNIKANKNELLTALEKVYIFVKDKKERKNVAEFLFKDQELKISGFGDYGNTSSSLYISKECDDLKIHLNVKYILEYLNTIKNTQIVDIKLHDEHSAILLKEDGNANNNVYLTMPLKI